MFSNAFINTNNLIYLEISISLKLKYNLISIFLTSNYCYFELKRTWIKEIPIKCFYLSLFLFFLKIYLKCQILVNFTTYQVFLFGNFQSILTSRKLCVL